jgi:hypothetical protein
MRSNANDISKKWKKYQQKAKHKLTFRGRHLELLQHATMCMQQTTYSLATFFLKLPLQHIRIAYTVSQYICFTNLSATMVATTSLNLSGHATTYSAIKSFIRTKPRNHKCIPCNPHIFGWRELEVHQEAAMMLGTRRHYGKSHWHMDVGI